jgi:hypothetical protein
VAGLLGVLLGPIGVHRFYLGYQLIGILQFLACFTGIGALWGWIEGVIILSNAPFSDADGRLLAPYGSGPTDASQRSGFFRVIWAVVAFALGVATIGSAGGAIFPEPDIDSVRLTMDAQPYHINTNRLFFFLSSAAVSASIFSAWKAGHRPGLSMWRATGRPLLMCGLLALAGSGIVFYVFVAAGAVQLVGMLATAAALVGMLIVWQLRGPEPRVSAEGVYWHRAWIGVFRIVGVLSLVGGIVCMGIWNGPSYRSPSRNLPGGTVMADDGQFYFVSPKSITNRYYGGDTQLRIPLLMYRHEPLAAFACALLLIGAIGEVRHRRNLIEDPARRRPAI